MLIYNVRTTQSGYFVDAVENDGHVIGTYLVTRGPFGYACSCEAFAKTKNQYNHFHIMVVKQWLKDGSSDTARYYKGDDKRVHRLVD